MERGCWSFIEGTKPPLDETTATRREKSEYKQRQDRALATIYYGIDEHYRTLISSTTSPSKAWIILKEQFEPVSRASVMRLLDEFFSIKFNPDAESIAVFIARIPKMVERLKDVGHPLNDMYCAFQAIRTLSPEFQGIVHILYRWPDEDFKLDKIEIELIVDKNWLKQLKNDLMSVQTVRNVLHGAGVKANTPRKKPYISEVNRKRRLEFAVKYQNKPMDFWKKFFAPKGEKLFFAKRFRDLYFLKPKYHPKDVYNNVESSNIKEGNKHFSGNIVLWHNRFCHMNIDHLVQTTKVSAVNGLAKFKNEKLDCESCKLAKTKRVSFKPIGRIKSIKLLQLVHMDVCSPLPVVSCGGANALLVEWLRQQTKLPHLSEVNPQVYVETLLHPEKLTVWCALWDGGIIGPYFKNDEGHNVTINGDRYRAMITNLFIPELNNHDVQELWFQQDGATCHTARATIDLLKDAFGDRLISRFGPVNWPPRSCDLTPLDYFLWGYVMSLVYADKPQTLDHLEDNIRRVIADIRPQMLEKVIENWTSRSDNIRASRGSPMPEIIFKM
ncbi:uncharacterized protein TNCV_487341 [Trichonephila clavipes]|nr:uncharacterized protein TNCV_487341 [Trichonephila clavipes]